MTEPQDPSAPLPQVPSDLSERMRRELGEEIDPRVTLTNLGADESRAPSSAALASPTGERYTFDGEIARGGMGAVLAVYDQDLRRNLAMKMILTREEGAVDRETLGRFLEEAQVTAQLDHPGVVPIHELGLDAAGQVYFTMKLVKGQDLRAVFEKVKAGDEEWTTTRVLSLLLRVCEAMAFAHSKGVIHRDLKPANIMVGRFGEVYVMDWGISRVLGQPDRKDRRLRTDPPQTSVVASDRREERKADDSPDQPLLTMDGDVIGTPAYMPVEQAEGRLADIGPQSDVYSLGSILYELLAGQMPYVTPGSRVSARTILGMVLQGPPRALEELAPRSAPELLAICNKAMARRKEDRYPTTQELAADLRAFLEQRVVRAYRTGPVVEMRKWVERNKGLAASLLAALVLLFVLGWTAVEAAATKDKNIELSEVNEDLALAVKERNQANASLNARNQLLGDLEVLRDLRQRERDLWPARPALLGAMDAWLGDASDLLGRIPLHERDLRELRAQAATLRDEDVALAITRSSRRQEFEDASVLLEEIELLLQGQALSAERRAELIAAREPLVALRSEVEAQARAMIQWRFPADPQDQWYHDNLSALVQGARALETPESGLLASMLARRDRASSIEDATLGEHFDAWLEAVDAIADSERYGGLELSEQVGLVPLGPDPDSGLWEFWHHESGARPQWSPEEGVRPAEGMGIVLVLIPGGSFWMGASRGPTSPNHDLDARADEGPVRELSLDPYFLSKYELSQGQWFRLKGERPSLFASGQATGGKALLDTNPVTNLSWESADEVLRRYGLRLPTEAQWERGARAGSSTPWWCGDRASIASEDGVAGNVLDEGAMNRGAPVDWGIPEAWDDGEVVHAPAGSFRANPFGLHEVLGNVSEWCQDEYASSAYQLSMSREDGHRLLLSNRSDGSGNRVLRGGSFHSAAVEARSATRNYGSPSDRSNDLGLRPAKGLER